MGLCRTLSRALLREPALAAVVARQKHGRRHGAEQRVHRRPSCRRVVQLDVAQLGRLLLLLLLLPPPPPLLLLLLLALLLLMLPLPLLVLLLLALVLLLLALVLLLHCNPHRHRLLLHHHGCRVWRRRPPPLQDGRVARRHVRANRARPAAGPPTHVKLSSHGRRPGRAHRVN
eukprot:SAG25_NODE_202_length_11981_cov_16.926612_3_plen_173_part_00